MDKKTPLFSITKKDLDIQTFRSGGPGGQHQNTTDSGVRIIHKESGAVGESRQFRSQYQNKRAALERLTQTVNFKLWLNRKVFNLDCDLESKVDSSMQENNLKVEVFDGNKWVKEDT